MSLNKQKNLYIFNLVNISFIKSSDKDFFFKITKRYSLSSHINKKKIVFYLIKKKILKEIGCKLIICNSTHSCSPFSWTIIVPLEARLEYHQVHLDPALLILVLIKPEKYKKKKLITDCRPITFQLSIRCELIP